MLAPNFMTAAELCIRSEWRDALVLLLREMERGGIVKFDLDSDRDYTVGDPRLFLGRFNMGVWSGGTPCGTVCCMGGAAEILGKVRLLDNEDRWTTELYDLFYPPVSPNYNEISVEQATTALRGYLTTGVVDWKSV